MQNLPDDFDATVEAHQRELIESAATLYAVQKICGDTVREQTKRAYGRLVEVHLLTTGVLATGLLRINGKITPYTATNEERSSLFANYVIGMVVCERAIEEGRYLQAHALLRQEMETLAQLQSGERRGAKKPPFAIPPNNRLETLKGERAEQWSIRINGQWRVCFVWNDGHASRVEICDYH